MKRLFFQTLVAPGLKLVHAIGRGLEKIVKLFENVANVPQKMFNAVLKPFKVLKSIPGHLENLLKKPRSFFSNLIENIPSFPRVKINTAPLKKVFQDVSARVESVFHAVGSAAQKIKPPIQNLVKKLGALREVVTNSLYRTLKPVMDRINSVRRRGVEGISKLARKAVEGTRKVIQGISKVAAPVIGAAQVLQHVPERCWIAFQNSFFYQVGEKLTFSIGNVIHTIKEIVQKIGEVPKLFSGLGQKGKAFVKKVRGMGQSLAKNFKRLLQKGKKAPKAIKELLVKGAGYFHRGLSKLIAFILAFLSGLGYLLSYWMEQVRETASSLLKFK